MPIIGLVSDIHANADALEAVLDDAASVGVDALVCLGDVIGYGPDPVRCLEIVASTCEVMIRGNHEEALLNGKLTGAFNPRAKASARFTRRALTDEHVGLVELMQPHLEIGDLSLTHGSFNALRYEYIYSVDAAERSFANLRTPIGIVGHTHVPCAFVMSGFNGCATIQSMPLPPGAEMPLNRGTRAILNPGSVGQPRDRNPDASWGVLDSDRMTFQVRRVAYDVEAVQRKMIDLGLPDVLSQRLRIGA